MANEELEQMGAVPEQPEEELPYIQYALITLGLFYLEAIMGIVIPNLDPVFNFLAAIACSCLGFGFPAAFFLGAEKYFPKASLASKNGFHRVMAYIHGVLAVIVFLVCFYAAIANLIDP